MTQRIPGIFLLAAVFVIAVCGLVYELIAAALSSYLLGGSVTQFSIVIGIFLTAMGVGSYLTRFFRKNLTDVFVGIQIGIGVSGGLSAAVLLFTFAVLPAYLPALVIVLTITGTLVGMEIPLLIRILKKQRSAAAYGFQRVGFGLCRGAYCLLRFSSAAGTVSRSSQDLLSLRPD